MQTALLCLAVAVAFPQLEAPRFYEGIEVRVKSSREWWFQCNRHPIQHIEVLGEIQWMTVLTQEYSDGWWQVRSKEPLFRPKFLLLAEDPLYGRYELMVNHLGDKTNAEE